MADPDNVHHLHRPTPGSLIIVIHIVTSYRDRDALCGHAVADEADDRYAHLAYSVKAPIVTEFRDDDRYACCHECYRIAGLW